MSPTSVYIIGGNKTKINFKINNDSKVIFLDKTTKSYDDQFSLLKEFQANQDILRTKFIKLQDQVFKKMQHLIIKDEDYRYLLTNLFFEASPYKTDLIYKFFKLNLIIDFIRKNQIKKIYLFNVTEEIQDFFNHNSHKLSYSVKKIFIKKKLFSLKFQLRMNPLGALLTHLILEFKKKKTKLLPQNSMSRKVVLSSYPGHSFNNSFSSNYYAEVSSILNDGYAWLFMYSGSVSKLSKENKLISNHVNSFGFLDAYFSLINFKEIIINFFRIRKKLKSIDLKNTFIFEDIDYYSFIKKDWLMSFSTVLINTLIYEKKFQNFFKVNPKIEEIIFLMEYHPWEMMLNKVAHRSKVKTKGTIHSILRPNLMNWYYSKFMHSFYYTPSYVGANNNFSRKRFLDNGFNSNQVFMIEAQKYNYLHQDNIKLDNKKLKKKKSILISTSINYKETKELLEIFFLANTKFEKVYIKEHPRMPIRPIIDSSIKGFPSYELIEGSMQDAFKFSDIVYVANSSSVLLESVLLKKHTVSLISLSTLPIPAIDRASNLYFVEDESSLSNILTQLINESEIYMSKNNTINDLYIDEGLSLWRNFLKI